MVSYISDVITVTLNYGGEAIDTESFNIPLAIVTHNATANLVDIFTSSDDVLSAGHAEDSAAYKMAVLMFQGVSKPQQFIIGKRTLSDFSVNFTAVNSTEYTVTLKSGTTTKDFSFTSDSSATSAEISAGLEALIAADSTWNAIITPTVTSSGELILTPVSGKYADVSVGDNAILTKNSDQTMTDAITSIYASNNTWFWVISDSHVDADVLELAAYVEEHDRIYYLSTQDVDVPNAVSGNILNQLNALSYKNTILALYYSTADTTFPEAAAVSTICNSTPGTDSMHLKPLTGVAVESLTTTQKSNMVTQGGNIYVTEYGVSSYRDGRMVSGGYYVDYIAQSLWFKARLKESIFSLLRRQSLLKSGVRFTTKGLTKIKNAIKESPVNVGINNGSIANEIDTDSDTGLTKDLRPTITVPNRADISTSDIAARTLNDVVVTYIYAGFVNYVNVTVNVEIDADATSTS